MGKYIILFKVLIFKQSINYFGASAHKEMALTPCFPDVRWNILESESCQIIMIGDLTANYCQSVYSHSCEEQEIIILI